MMLICDFMTYYDTATLITEHACAFQANLNIKFLPMRNTITLTPKKKKQLKSIFDNNHQREGQNCRKNGGPFEPPFILGSSDARRLLKILDIIKHALRLHIQ